MTKKKKEKTMNFFSRNATKKKLSVHLVQMRSPFFGVTEDVVNFTPIADVQCVRIHAAELVVLVSAVDWEAVLTLLPPPQPLLP